MTSDARERRDDDLSKHERAYRTLRERILSNQYGPGYRLVIDQLAAEFGVSAVPIREALRRLEAEKLVHFERNVGARVTPLDASEWEGTMHVLALLEGYATALAAPRVTRAMLARARRINAEMRTRTEQYDALRVTSLNRDFHFVLYERCPSPHLIELVRAEWDRLDAMRRSVFQFIPLRALESVEEHDEILRRIESGAPAGEIEAIAREHRMRTIQAYLEREGAVPTIPVTTGGHE